MEELLQTLQNEQQEKSGWKANVATTVNPKELESALKRFAQALRNAAPLLVNNDNDINEQKESENDGNSLNAINADWLLDLCRQIPSELSARQIAREIWEASTQYPKDSSQQQEALYTAVGASDQAMEILFQVAPHVSEIAQNIKLSQLVDPNDYNSSSSSAAAATTATATTFMDPEEARREQLRQEAMTAAQVATLAQEEVNALTGGRQAGATHTVVRASHVEAQKNAEKAAKKAQQALDRAKAAGAIIDENELLQVDSSQLGHGGLIGHNHDQIQNLQQSLLPEGSRQHYNPRTGLPHGAEQDHDDKIGFDRVVVPPTIVDKSKLHERLNIQDVIEDRDCAKVFAGTTSLNPMQSTVFETAFHKRYNMLVCAPTGAGKTNVALLTVAAHFRDVGLIGANNINEQNSLDAGAKVVYIAPMKALAQEVVSKFSDKLNPLNLIVKELTGDMQLTRAEAQAANVIVTTPEKWDVVTRKSGNDDNSLGNQCGLLIIDEVHLLADDRGAVIESVVSRLHRSVESRQRQLRIVGLSATLPNYQDVATFLQVPEKGLFFFGPEHRPVPLQQTFIGVTGRVKDRHLMERKMNDVCYEYVVDSLQRGYQVMVFVHSRKGTSDAATELATRASAKGVLETLFVTKGKDDSHGKANKKYADKAKKARSREVSNHFDNGMGIHHAGMLRGDRKLTENMFAEGAIKVLCCTATLAWGINLPAHTVIIKGTEVYNPEKGKNVDLSILDVQQIFGRAGRPQFDTSGEATLITDHEAMVRYLAKLVKATPIESTFVKQLADHLNAEIVGGTVTNVQEAASWLAYTYLYVRMLRNPLAYGINSDQKADDPMLRNHCLDLVRQAATMLAQNMMVNYDVGSGNLSMTEMGRIAAHFYIQAESIITFNEMMALKLQMTDSDILKLIAAAGEFTNIRVRQEETKDLEELQKGCLMELEGPVHDAATKSYVLLQAYISRTKINNFTLISDTNYIASNAGRVARAIFEICLNKRKAGAALKMLRVANSVDHQWWWFQNPLRHFVDELGMDLIKRLESKLTGFDAFESALSLLDMQPEEVGQMVQSKKHIGAKIQKHVRMLPKAKISCHVMPVTSSVLRFHIHIEPDFEWIGRWHGGALSFWLWIEDTESGRIYHSEHILFSRRKFPEPLELDIPVPVFSPMPSQYILRFVSDSWVGIEMVYPIPLSNVSLPQQKTPYTELQNLTPLPTTALQEEKYEKLYTKIDSFNPVQTQLFHVLYHTDLPVLLGAPTGSGKTYVAELALLRMKRLFAKGICVYIAPLKSLARERLNEWRKRLGSAPLHWKILELSGDTHHDQKALQSADVLVCTPEKWDLISRGWKGSANNDVEGSNVANGKSFIKRVRLLVIDEIHLLGEERGAVLEAIVSRTRFISTHLEKMDGIEKPAANAYVRGGKSEIVRIIGLSTAVANPVDLADWIGIESIGSKTDVRARRGLYNFKPAIRPVPTTIHLQGFPGKHYCPRMATMNKPCYAAIKQHSPENPVLIFVASRRQTRLTAFDLISYAAGEERPKTFLRCSETYVEAIAETIQDEALRHTLTFGIGLHHAGLSSHDREIVEGMFLRNEIQVLVATATLAWGVNLPARLVIVKGTEYFDGKTSRYVDYPLTDVLQMIGRAGRPGFDTKGSAVVLCEISKKEFYKKFLYQPFPVESCLSGRLCENLNAEIAIGTVNSIIDAVGYLTWTFFARRVKENPSFYGAESGSDEHVQEFLFSIATETIQNLKEQGCVELGTGNNDIHGTVRPTVLGIAASNYYLQYRTPRQMQFGVREGRKIVWKETSEDKVQESSKQYPLVRSDRVDEVSTAWLLYSLCCTHEFDELPVRHNEEILNEELSDVLMWGPDTAQVMSPDSGEPYHNPDIYADPHTKAFLLLQAYMEHSKLPISDYINDTKSVMDNVPRLLAAMQHIAEDDASTAGTFELITQFYRARQLLVTRSIVADHPLELLPGMKKMKPAVLNKLAKSFDLSNETSQGSFFALRSLARQDAVNQLKKASTKNGTVPIRVLLDGLYATPIVSVTNATVTHTMDKTGTKKSIGKVKIEIEISQEASQPGGNKKKDNNTMDENTFSTCSLILGTLQNRFLLGHSSFGLPKYVGSSKKESSSKVTKEIEFDWASANADGGEGGGFILLRILFDNVRGMDSEMRIALG